MYRDSNIPEEFNKVLYFSDNYIVWTNSSTIITDRSYNVYVQYLYPSPYYFYIADFKLPLSYYSSLAFSYDSGDGILSLTPSSTSSYSIDTSNIDSNFGSRADFPSIFIVSFLLTFLFVFLLNNLTKLVKKGRYFRLDFYVILQITFRDW